MYPISYISATRPGYYIQEWSHKPKEKLSYYHQLLMVLVVSAF